jgi:hypothetical protein
MAIEVTKEKDGSYTLTMNIRLEGSLLHMEEQIATSLNQLGSQLTGQALQGLDTDGRAIVSDNIKYTSKGLQKKSTKPLTGKRR